jgi:3-methyladenine DNA glycosylase AlkD
VCFHLFDRSAHAWSKAAEWSADAGEFQKRAGFALLWSLSVHDKRAADEAFRQGLEWIERESGDARNFVRKAVNMALRAIGKRNRNLNVAAEGVAGRLAGSPNPTSRWIGKHALRELTSVAVRKRVAER